MMKHLKYIFLVLFIALQACGVYNFTGGNPGLAKTFKVEFFQNNAPIIEPGLDRDFTLALQDLITSQTNLTLISANAAGGDLVYGGEIVEYRVTPTSATANQTAAQNRLTIAVNVRFVNNVEEEKDFERRFSFFFDFPATTQVEAVEDTAFQEIFDRLTQDIFNASLADW